MEKYLLRDDGAIPNNEHCALLVYKAPVELNAEDPALTFEQTFADHGWTKSWRNGIFDFHHYHSTAHEVLGIYSGEVRVQLGGENGIVLTAEKGDVIVIPAGVAHKNLESSNLGVVGAYDRGRKWDMNYGKSAERKNALKNIKNVPKPLQDPVFGYNGPLIETWSFSILPIEFMMRIRTLPMSENRFYCLYLCFPENERYALLDNHEPYVKT